MWRACLSPILHSSRTRKTYSHRRVVSRLEVKTYLAKSNHVTVDLTHLISIISKGRKTNMPWLKDAISSFKVSPETTKYKSPKFEVLDWMQRHPEELQEATFKMLAHSMKPEFADADERLLISRIGNLTDAHLIFYFPYRRAGKKHYYLNYFHKDFPPEIKARASEEELSKVRNLVHIYEHKVSDKFAISPQTPIIQKAQQEVKQEELKQEEKPNQEKPIVIPIDTKNLPEGGLSVNLNIQFVFNN